jgi:hypothetical protein
MKLAVYRNFEQPPSKQIILIAEEAASDRKLDKLAVPTTTGKRKHRFGDAHRASN